MLIDERVKGILACAKFIQTTQIILRQLKLKLWKKSTNNNYKTKHVNL